MVEKVAKKATKKTKKGKSKKKSKKPKVEKTTVEKIPSPEGSVHFNEFLTNCRQPKLPPILSKPTQKKKKDKKGKKGKKAKKEKSKKNKKQGKSKKKKGAKLAKKKVVVKPDVIPPIKTEPPSFPLIKALLLPTHDGDLVESALFSEFAVGKNDTLISDYRKVPKKEVSVLEKQANDTVDEINNVQENIRLLKENPKPNQSEIAKLEEQQTLLLKLVDDFENYLDKIRTVFNNEQAIIDEQEWVDITEEQETIDTEPCLECQFPFDEINETEEHSNTKWYEKTDLAYLLSPNTSFNRKANSAEDLLGIINVLQNKPSADRNIVTRNDLFKRLKKKFSILLPPAKLEVTKEHMAWIDNNLYKEHVSMLKATDNLKLFQCWKNMEFKFDIINALAVSLKDAIKSTNPIYYANNETKEQFVSDQSDLVQALDDFRRKTKDIYRRAGLDDYWQIHPPSIRLGVRPSFEITIKQRQTNIDEVIKLDEQKLTFLERNMFIPKSKSNCKSDSKDISKDSEIEVQVHNLT